MRRSFPALHGVIAGALAVVVTAPIAARAQTVVQAGHQSVSRSAALAAARPFEVFRAEFAEKFNHGNAAALAEMHADSGVYLTADGQLLTGREAIRETYARVLPRALGFEAHANTIDPRARLTTEVGWYEERVSPAPGQLRNLVGRYIAVWAHTRDEGWKVQLLATSNDSVEADPAVERAVADYYSARRTSAAGQATTSFVADHPRLDLRPDEMIITGTHAVVHWSATGQATDGRATHFTGVDLLTVAPDGRVTPTRSYWTE